MARRSEKYDRAFSATRQIVNKHDPIGLIELGAPDDEYEPEVTDLVRLVLKDVPLDEGAVEAVWIRWFGDIGRLEGTPVLAALTRDLLRLRADSQAREA